MDRTFALLETRDIQRTDVLVAAEVGSTAHGMSVAEADDLDLTIVRMETWSELVNGPASRQSMMIRSQPEGRRSGPGDIDLMVYTARHFAGLALRGNPSILNVLFAPSLHYEHPVWRELRSTLKRHAVSKRAGAAFLGYMHRQMERWQGHRPGKRVSRPELVEQHGFDTKYAAHAIRLGMQGTAFMRTGEIPIPLPPMQAGLLRSLRTGQMTESAALDLVRSLEAELRDAKNQSVLPEQADTKSLYIELAETYRSWFKAPRT